MAISTGIQPHQYEPVEALNISVEEDKVDWSSEEESSETQFDLAEW